MPASMHILPFGTRGSIWDMSPLMITSQPPFFTKPSTQPAGQPPASSWAVAALAAVRRVVTTAAPEMSARATITPVARR